MLDDMSLIRFLGRSMFASAFIADGIKKVTKPAEQAPEAEAFTHTVTPLLQRVAPAGYSSHVPDQAETWVRLTGGAQVLGGAMFATGIFRRLGALLLTKASIVNVAMAWPSKDAPAEERAEGRSKALTHAALLGAALVASQDLQGKPSLAWRTEHTAERAANKAGKAKGKVQKEARKAAKQARKQAKKVSKKIDSAIH